MIRRWLRYWRSLRHWDRLTLDERYLLVRQVCLQTDFFQGTDAERQALLDELEKVWRYAQEHPERGLPDTLDFVKAMKRAAGCDADG